MKHFNANNILDSNQHGFRTGHSCETQLIQTLDVLAQDIDEKHQTDVVILDFSKEFGTVSHQRLVQKPAM